MGVTSCSYAEFIFVYSFSYDLPQNLVDSSIWWLWFPDEQKWNVQKGEYQVVIVWKMFYLGKIFMSQIEWTWWNRVVVKRTMHPEYIPDQYKAILLPQERKLSNICIVFSLLSNVSYFGTPISSSKWSSQLKIFREIIVNWVFPTCRTIGNPFWAYMKTSEYRKKTSNQKLHVY